MSSDTETILLARVYSLILSWPNPEETADPDTLGEDAEPAKRSTALFFNDLP
jgi:hypothetical protein